MITDNTVGNGRRYSSNSSRIADGHMMKKGKGVANLSKNVHELLVKS